MIEFEYFGSIRDLVNFVNKNKIGPKEIIQTVPAQGILGYYLIYNKTNRKPQEKDAQ